MGKRVDILVVDGLGGLEELGVFGVVFFVGGLFGLNWIRGWGDALQVHVEDGHVDRLGKEQEVKVGKENEKSGWEEKGRNRGAKPRPKERKDVARVATVGQIRQALSRLPTVLHILHTGYYYFAYGYRK